MDARERANPGEETDAALLAAFAAGDVGAMDRLVARYRQALFSWLLGMTGVRADAEDLFQEVWIRIIRGAGRFRDVSFKAWMWKIARNMLIDFRRKRRPSVSLDADREGCAAPLVERLEAPGPAPGRQTELCDEVRRAMEAVARLPGIQREVFLLRTQGELSFKEIARTLGIPLNTALGRMHDAVGKLKRAWKEEEMK